MRRVVRRSDFSPRVRTLRHFRNLLARGNPVELGIHDHGPVPEQVAQTARNPLSHPDLLEVQPVAESIRDHRHDVGCDVHPSLAEHLFRLLRLDHALDRLEQNDLGDHRPIPAGIERARDNGRIIIECSHEGSEVLLASHCDLVRLAAPRFMVLRDVVLGQLAFRRDHLLEVSPLRGRGTFPQQHDVVGASRALVEPSRCAVRAPRVVCKFFKLSMERAVCRQVGHLHRVLAVRIAGDVADQSLACLVLRSLEDDDLCRDHDMAEINGAIVARREVDGRGGLPAVHDLQALQERQAQISVLSPLERRFVADKNEAIVEGKKVLRFLSQRFDDALVDRALVPQEGADVGFEQRRPVAQIKIPDELPGNGSKGILVVCIRVRDVDAGERPTDRLDETHGQLVSRLALGVAEQPLHIHGLNGHHLLVNLLVREPFGLGLAIGDDEHTKSVNVAPARTNGCDQVPDRMGRIDLCVEVAACRTKEKANAFACSCGGIRVPEIVQFLSPEIVGHEQVESRFIGAERIARNAKFCVADLAAPVANGWGLADPGFCDMLHDHFRKDELIRRKGAFASLYALGDDGLQVGTKVAVKFFKAHVSQVQIR
ncbi:hypothetical protein EIO_0696 [Ketogulonicigenium vulgare Y25]|nr:hypothetical protein EIO_0696 [Ketogulonicigenium vulgare Y25]AOZ53778.1 hypothetical protein KVC_0758 [Ketogulonicigenium vulgare]